MEYIYLTTTLPYANSIPHIGHALEFIQADAYSRFFKYYYGEKNVFFNVGLDEHGLKLYNTAIKHNVTPVELISDLRIKWIDFCSKFNINFDVFYETSDKKHYTGVKNIWKKCLSNNDIYKKQYSGLYCVGCESFLKEKDLVDGLCPDHLIKPILYSEENYFFRLSKYKKEILDYINNNEDFIKPYSKRIELINFVTSMEDISISRNRNTVPWGIQVPNDPTQTIYVWFDALTNYIQSIGYNINNDNFNKWWPGYQFCGPDNLRFQGAIWQAILCSLNLKFSKKILVHGTILGPDGRKMSKTLGNIVSPLEQYEKYGCDPIRFYMLGFLPTYKNCSYRETDLVEYYNSFLANSYGNLINRLIHLSKQRSINYNKKCVSDNFIKKINDFTKAVKQYYLDFELNYAVKQINEIVMFGNQYFNKNEPWKQEKNQAEKILVNIAYLIKKVNELYYPIIPESSLKIKNILNNKEQKIIFPRLKKI